MPRVEKSRRSFRQELRNPSTRWVIGIPIVVLIILGAIFGPGEWDTVSTNFDNRPTLAAATPWVPVARWSHAEATAFFTNYAVSNPPPVGLETIPGIITCWDYVLYQTGEAPEIVSFRSSVTGIGIPQGGSVSLWSALAGRRAWRFWENTRSVLGPC